jgi:ABC-type polysaccharide transport system permease subunit
MAASTASASDLQPSRRWIPWVLMAPGLIWLLVFFAIPMFIMGRL